MSICIDKYYINKNDKKSYITFYKDGKRYITDGTYIKRDSNDVRFYSIITEELSSCNVSFIVSSLRNISGNFIQDSEYRELADVIEYDYSNKMNSFRKFTLLDEDSFQIMRPWLNNSFEFYQLQYLSEGNGIFVCHAVIYPEAIDTRTILDCYGYKSVDEIKAEYGKEYESFLAECAFELLCAEGKCILAPSKAVSWNEGANMIRILSGYGK